MGIQENTLSPSEQSAACFSGSDILRQKVNAAEPRVGLLIKLAVSASHNILTPNQPVLALTLFICNNSNGERSQASHSPKGKRMVIVSAGSKDMVGR